ncbi:MAG: AbrB/MazE/SpoVT family DNA-binding domain-containing protein [Thaumarchaeota archaeon]|nr:AbrB/MazE/SpoVT family DNA-binding domain-containing protein [Nitrososphaerota archaeon]
MSSAPVDSKGRVLIPKEIRRRTRIKEGSYVKLSAQEGKVVMEPLESVADKFFGAFEIHEWPKDLDKFQLEASRRWWASKDT